ncbi:MAG TPA: hypothetical protein VGJ28_04935 [Micromonosporaceae bacterium]|jgi:hypothetical protein
MSDPYPSYPAPPSGEYGPPAVPRERPAVVTMAVRLLYLNVLVGLIGVVILFATKDDLKKQILKDTPTASDSTVNAALTVGAVIAIVLLLLFALLAWQVGKGKNWARITTWVFAGLGVLSGLAAFARPETTGNRILGIVGLAIDIAVIVLLARPQSNEFFRPRYG